MSKPIFTLVLTLISVITIFSCYEWYLRSRGYGISYDDTSSLFADRYRHLYDKPATVFIGSSRIKYDISPEVWKRHTGEEAVQLGHVGSSPKYYIYALAKDSLFNGKLIIDGTENLLFNLAPRVDASPKEALDFALKETPAQRFSFTLNQMLESKFVFLDYDFFALNALIDKLPWPKRKKREFPKYPAGFQRTTPLRQCYLTEDFEHRDTAERNLMRKVWVSNLKDPKKDKLLDSTVVDSFIQTIATSISSITERGGTVSFIRPPSTGPLWENEQHFYPRNLFWEKLLHVTGCKGIYFQDYPSLKDMSCPEFSHLNYKDSEKYTEQIIQILQQDCGWKFSKS